MHYQHYPAWVQQPRSHGTQGIEVEPSVMPGVPGASVSGGTGIAVGTGHIRRIRRHDVEPFLAKLGTEVAALDVDRQPAKPGIAASGEDSPV
jgi:hypothetical protein